MYSRQGVMVLYEVLVFWIPVFGICSCWGNSVSTFLDEHLLYSRQGRIVLKQMRPASSRLRQAAAASTGNECRRGNQLALLRRSMMARFHCNGPHPLHKLNEHWQRTRRGGLDMHGKCKHPAPHTL